MSAAAPKTPMGTQPPREPGSARMIGTMGAIGFACGMLIVLTFQLTLPTIERNKREALERAIFEVVPGAVTKETFTERDGRLVPAPNEDMTPRYYACYDGDRALVGVAVEAEGQGFQDLLKLLYGVSTASQEVVGLKVLQSKETPGLGDKIETDPEFRANFEALDVGVTGDGGIEHPIVLVKPGEKTQPWQIQAITGATISSRAVATILEKSTAVTVPLIVDNLAALEAPPQ